jgi:hypothetical protein
MGPSASPAPSRPGVLHFISWSRLLPALGFLLYGLFLARFAGACAGGSDTSGYLNNARLIGRGHLLAPMRLVPGLNPDTVPPYTQVPLGFIPNADHVTMTPTYPMGLSLLIAAVAQVIGWELAPGLVLGLHSLVGLWLMYRLGREAGLEAGWAWLGALLLAASPVYVSMSLQVMSDVPATVWVTAAVLGAWTSRGRPWLALAAGAALAMAVLVRPADLVALVPVALALGFSHRRWLLLAVGALPGAVFQGALNLEAYGRVFTTGYGYVNPNFGLGNVLSTLVHYAAWLPVMLTPLGLLALGLPVLNRRPASFPAVLAAWALVFPVFYLFYAHTREGWWSLRFLLPAFPPILVAALLVARRLAARLKFAPRAWWLAPAAAAILVHGVAWSRHLHAYTIGRGEKAYPQVAAWLQTHLPANAVVASMQTSGALLYYTKFTFIRWDMMSPAEFQRIAAACAAAGQPVYAALFPFEIDDPAWQAFPRHLTGHWTQIGAVREVTIWRFDSPPVP